MNPCEGIGKAIAVLVVAAALAGGCTVIILQKCPYSVHVSREGEK